MKQEFKILNYNPIWQKLYTTEKLKLIKIFNKNLNSIHHIGSTAIRNTKAKPEIDILIVVKEDKNLSTYNNSIEKLGYKVRGECLENGGTPGRFYYSKDSRNKRTHKLHVCKIGHPDILAQLTFVNYLNNHNESALAYAELKTNLSKQYNYGKNIEKYIAGKSDFIKDVLNKARKENTELKYEDFL